MNALLFVAILDPTLKALYRSGVSTYSIREDNDPKLQAAPPLYLTTPLQSLLTWFNWLKPYLTGHSVNIDNSILL